MAQDLIRRRILDLGLEDDIPLWEITDTCRAAGLITGGEVGLRELRRAILDLVRSDEIRIVVGRWHDSDPRQVSAAEAEVLLADERRYASPTEIAHDLERVSYVNVDNLSG